MFTGWDSPEAAFFFGRTARLFRVNCGAEARKAQKAGACGRIIYEGFDNVHMDDFYYINKSGKEKFNRTLFHIVGELECYSKDIEKGQNLKVRDVSRINMDRNHYARYYNHLFDENNPSPIEVRERLQKIFHRDWIVRKNQR